MIYISARKAPPHHQTSHIENRWSWRVEVAQHGVPSRKTDSPREGLCGDGDKTVPTDLQDINSQKKQEGPVNSTR